MKKLMITIDVEAQPGRAEAHHVDRLIWGKCPNGQAGISEMMDLADRHGIRLTLFLDYTEQHLYGEELLDVGREIWRRGHDLQLHAHLEFLPKAFWLDRGLSACYKLDEVSLRQADAVFDFLCARHHDITGQQPIAFRGGGYRFNDAVLRSMRVRGLLIDTSLNVARERRTVLTTPRKQFAWSTGCLEIPISLASSFRNRHQQFEFNFNSSAFTDAASLIDFLDQFYDEHGEDAIAVLVMHSWSFLRLLNRKYFTEVLPSNLEKFDEFLSRLPGDVTVVDTRDLASL